MSKPFRALQNFFRRSSKKKSKSKKLSSAVDKEDLDESELTSVSSFNGPFNENADQFSSKSITAPITASGHSQFSSFSNTTDSDAASLASRSRRNSRRRSSQKNAISMHEKVIQNSMSQDKNKNHKVKEKNILKLTDSQMYMKESNEDIDAEAAAENSKNVVAHLLSQVKFGMDLSKVTLPTFILEKRSLLEMYADFFSHADLFVQISQKETPEKRFIACLCFYLSTFSAGRNSKVAKKPYNPILGEIFRCLWDDRPRNGSAKSSLVEDGPLPWCKSNQLSFLAEQVSHHPPISAFYAEHKDSKIQFNGHIWTKSKFLGLSVQVQNVGQGSIYLLDYNEEYIVNFPSGYGRSILNVPWVELGGDCTITCEKTGYSSVVKFHTKPFYGGKVHKVTGEVVKPNVKKPICTFEGEWNNVITGKFSDGKTVDLFDIEKQKITKKVRKLEHQESNESRRLWCKVTENLSRNDIEAATEAKQSIEDKQRKDAKYRLQNALEYNPKYFIEDENSNWIFSSSLRKRI